MSLVNRLVGRTNQTRAVSPPDTLWLRQAFFAEGSASGATVTVDRALHLDSVMACVRVLSDSVGSLPIKTYGRATGGGRYDAWSNPVAKLLHDQPNPEMTAMDCWSLVMVHLTTWGNSYLGKAFDKRGNINALWPIRPDLIRVGRVNGQKVFWRRSPETLIEEKTPYTPGQILHIKAMSLDGLIGLSPIAYARETIGGGLAMDEYGNRFYANSAMPRGILSVVGDLDDSARARLQRSWEAFHRGSRNANRIAVLDNDAKFQPISVPLGDSQWIEGQKLTVQKVARLFRLPPSMVGSDSGSTLRYETVEWEGVNFVTYSLRPWLGRIEQALQSDPDLFPTTGAPMYPEFLTAALLRADTKTRYESYAIALGGTATSAGWMSRAEVREAENLPPEPTPVSGAAATDAAVRARDEMDRVLLEINAAKATSHTNGGARNAVNV